MSRITKIYRIWATIFLILFFLLGLGFIILVNNPKIQRILTTKTTQIINQSFGTDINIRNVKVDYFGRIQLQGIKIKDHKQNYLAEIEEVKIHISWISFFKNPNRFHLKKLNLYKPKIHVVTYKSEKKSNFDQFLFKFKSNKKNKNPIPILINAKIVDGELSIINQNLAKNKQIWLDAKNWQAEIEDLTINKGGIYACLNKMSFEASRSFAKSSVKNLSLDFSIEDKQLAFNNLNLKTDKTNLNGSLVFKFDSIQQFKKFKEEVVWDLRISKSKIAYQDIKYFIPTWDKDEVVTLSANISGPLSKFSLKNPSLDFGDHKLKADRIVLTKIYDKYNFDITAKKVEATLNQQQLQKKLPSIAEKFLPNFLSIFGDIDYKGDLKIQEQKILVDGYATTSKGDLTLKADFLDYNQKDIKYAGELEMKNLLVKDLLNINELNDLTGFVSFDGIGMVWGEMNLALSGNLSKMNFIDKVYSNVSFDGKLQKETYTGVVKVEDQKVNGTYNGSILLADRIGLNFESEIKKLDLYALGISADKFVLSGNYKGSVEFKTINDLLGQIEGKNIGIVNSKRSYNIADANIDLFYDKNSDKNLSLSLGNKLDANLVGDFVLTQVPDVIFNAIGSVTADYDKKQVDDNQKFKIEVAFLDESLSDFLSETFIDKGSFLSGEFDTTEEKYYISVKSSGFSFENIKTGESYLIIDSYKDDNKLLNKFEYIQFGNIKLNDVYLNTYMLNKSTKVNTRFSIGENKEIEFDLGLFQNKDKDGVYNLTLTPYSFIKTNGKEWYIKQSESENDNVALLDLNNGNFTLNQLNFIKENQQFSLEGFYKNDNDFKFVTMLKDVLLQDLIPKEFVAGLTIQGNANGNIDILNNGKEFEPKTNLMVTDFGVNGNTIGDLILDANFNTTKKVFEIDGKILKEKKKLFAINGEILNEKENPTLNIIMDFEKFDLSFVQPFLNNSLSNFRGLATGNALFQGSVYDPDFDAVVEIENFGIGIPYLGTDYLAKGYNDVDISKRKGSVSTIKINNINFIDTRFNTSGLVSGLVMFNKLSEWYLDLTIKSNNLLIMDTDYDLNENFFGKIFAKGDISLLGETNEMFVYGNADIGNNSNITINTSGTELISENNNLITFLNPNSDQENAEADQKLTSPKGITLDLTLKISSEAIANLLFDQQTGDKLTARGESENLKIVMLPNGEITMIGDYQLKSGVYNFRQVIPKDFQLVGGSYIKWTGSPYKADINLTAEYFRTVSNIGEYLNMSSPSEKVQLLIDIKNNLEDPIIDFAIRTPNAREEIRLSLSERLNNKDEELRQFGSILLSGKFFTNNPSNIQSTGTNIGTDLVLRQIGQVINNYLKEVDVNFEYIESNQLSQTSNNFKTELNLNINPRLQVDGSIGVPLQRTFNNDVLTGQVVVEYDISRKGNQELVLKAFSKPTTFGLENLNTSSAFAQSYGGGIVFRKSFDSIKEIFRAKDNTKYKPLFENILKFNSKDK